MYQEIARSPGAASNFSTLAELPEKLVFTSPAIDHNSDRVLGYLSIGISGVETGSRLSIMTNGPKNIIDGLTVERDSLIGPTESDQDPTLQDCKDLALGHTLELYRKVGQEREIGRISLIESNDARTTEVFCDRGLVDSVRGLAHNRMALYNAYKRMPQKMPDDLKRFAEALRRDFDERVVAIAGMAVAELFVATAEDAKVINLDERRKA